MSRSSGWGSAKELGDVTLAVETEAERGGRDAGKSSDGSKRLVRFGVGIDIHVQSGGEVNGSTLR